MKVGEIRFNPGSPPTAVHAFKVTSGDKALPFRARENRATIFRYWYAARQRSELLCRFRLHSWLEDTQKTLQRRKLLKGLRRHSLTRRSWSLGTGRRTHS